MKSKRTVRLLHISVALFAFMALCGTLWVPAAYADVPDASDIAMLDSTNSGEQVDSYTGNGLVRADEANCPLGDFEKETETVQPEITQSVSSEVMAENNSFANTETDISLEQESEKSSCADQLEAEEESSVTDRGDETRQPAHQKTIENGVYIIETGVSDSQVIDVSGAGHSNGTNVQIYNYNGTDAQRWQVTYDEVTGYYSIVNVGSQKALDIVGASTQDATNAQIYTVNGTNAQYWSLILTDSGYKIESMLKPGFVLDVAGAGVSDGTNIQAYSSNDTHAQRFWFIAITPDVSVAQQAIQEGCYEIVLSRDNKKVLDIPNASIADGVGAQVYDENGTMAQKYFFSYNQAGFYTIANISSGKVLDVANGSCIPGTTVQQYSQNGTAAQQWVLSLNDDGTYTIISRVNGLALDICAGQIANGTRTQVYRPNGTAAQRFILRSTTFFADGLYSLHASGDDNKVLDVPSASLSDVQIQIYEYNGTLAQKFTVSSVAENTYTIQSAVSSKYLTASNGILLQTSLTSDGNQLWIPTWFGSGLVFVNSATGMSMTLSDDSFENQTKVQIGSYTGSRLQSLRLAPVPVIDKGYYTLWSSAGDKVLDVKDGDRRDRSNVQIYHPNGTGSQIYYIEQVGDYYRIISAPSDRVLDVAYGSVSDGSNVQIYSYNGSNAQLWEVKLDTAGFMTFVNVGSGKALDVSGGVDADGTNVCIYARNGTNAQQWRAVPVLYTQDSYVVCAVPCPWNQYDVGLPTGCESMALTNTLLYWRFNLSPTTIADNYMPLSDSDFVYAFLGNPHSYNGNAIMAPGITNTANSFLSAEGSSLHAYNITGTSFGDLYHYVNQGCPVIVWNTVNMDNPGASWTSGDYTMYGRTHTVVLAGYDRETNLVYISDSISGAVWRDASRFGQIYSEMGSQAVVIC